MNELGCRLLWLYHIACDVSMKNIVVQFDKVVCLKKAGSDQVSVTKLDISVVVGGPFVK